MLIKSGCHTKTFLTLLFSIVVFLPAPAQQDSVIMPQKSMKNTIKQLIIPVSLITAGSLISGSTFEKNLNRDIGDAVGSNFHTKADNYLRFAPIAEMYAADALGLKAKNHWFDQTKNLGISLLVTNFITSQLKSITSKTRPNGAAIAHSFPSAHTSFAFTNATVLYEEYKDSSPLFACTGYGFATVTGSLRLMNNAHWLSDVMVGAGIGILVTKVVYLLDPLIEWNPFKNTKNIVMMPQVTNGNYGVYLNKSF